MQKHGGKREGAGRKSMPGTRRSFSVTLPDEKWAEIDTLIQNQSYSSLADYFRSLAIHEYPISNAGSYRRREGERGPTPDSSCR